MNRIKKKPCRNKQPATTKTPRTNPQLPTNYDKENPVWQVSTIDTEGAWGWHQMNGEIWNEIHKRITSFESMPWVEIYKTGSHYVPIKSLCSPAKKRLEDIQQDDTDRLFSLRITGIKRIWGIRDRNILKIIWWDPKHEVCPSVKKHT